MRLNVPNGSFGDIDDVPSGLVNPDGTTITFGTLMLEPPAHAPTSGDVRVKLQNLTVVRASWSSHEGIHGDVAGVLKVPFGSLSVLKGTFVTRLVS